MYQIYICIVIVGVLFALKVLMNNYFGGGGRQYFMGIPVPGKYSCWVELIAIQMITPNASFIGHLSGIIVGLIYMETGILRNIVSILENFLSGLLPWLNETGSSGNGYNRESYDRNRDYGSERSYGWRHDIYS
uniref:Rhomboid domain-containing protein n=1 Tax=Strongyloides stercoralis TaxID=6248 RepID=A0A0K0EN06_STRER